MARRPDFALIIFSNAYALCGFVVAPCFFIVIPTLSAEQYPLAASLSVVGGLLGLFMSWRSHQRRHVRRRVYLLLDRKIKKNGFRKEYFKNLSGGACLRFQHRLLFYRHEAQHNYHSAMREYRKNGVVYFQHPNEELEDELNFGGSSPELRAERVILLD